MASLSALWIISVTLAVGPLVLASDSPTINQMVLIEDSLYFKNTDVDYKVLKNHSMKLLTFHPNITSHSDQDISKILNDIRDAKSWTFLEQFLNKWMSEGYKFKKFKG